MSQENVETVERAIAAPDARDVDGPWQRPKDSEMDSGIDC